MRRYPRRVRSAILKGVMSFDLSPRQDTERALKILLDDCAADGPCHSAYPNIKQEYEQVIDRLAKSPVKVEVQNPETRRPEEVELPRVVFFSTMRTLLQNVGTANQVLSLIHQASQSNFLPFARLVLSGRQAAGSALSIGMTLSVLCSEDASKSPRAAIGPDGLDSACRVWPRGKLPRDFRKPVRARIPALLISGFLDPATPPRWAEEIASQLPESLHVVVRNASHSYTGLSPCVDNIMSDFISKGSTQALDVSCVNGIHRPPFQAPQTPSIPK
jgi:pimeloyl-ACP methyl ester carboxylesterase